MAVQGANAQPPKGFRRRAVADEAVSPMPDPRHHEVLVAEVRVPNGVSRTSATDARSLTGSPDQMARSLPPVPDNRMNGSHRTPQQNEGTAQQGGSNPEQIPCPEGRADRASGVTTGNVSVYRPTQPTPVEVLPIDLVTAWRLAARQNPTIGLTQQVVQENLAALLQARSIALPSLNAGGNYHLHDGNLQRSSGVILNTPNEQSIYLGGGARTLAAESVGIPAVRVYAPVADAWFGPLAARQVVAASQFDARATYNLILLHVAVRYLQLIGAEARFEALRRSELDMSQVLRPTLAFAQAGQGLESDANRAKSDALLLRSRVQAAEGEIAVASAELSKLLQLDPSIALRTPRNPLALVTVIDRELPLEELVQAALRFRPEISARTSDVAAAQVRLRQEQWRPALPTVAFGFSGGAFGGGSALVTPTFGNLAGRDDVDVLAFWTLQNFGVGNASLRSQRRAEVGQAVADRVLTSNEVREEVAAAYAESEARLRQVTVAERRLAAADTGFKNEVRRARANEGHPIETLNMVHLLIDARIDLIQSVIGYNEAQFRLFVAMGVTPTRAIPVAPPQAVPNTGMDPAPRNAPE